jgi:pimeloyl-ACP methyl ester carboxylesterase
MSSGADPVPAMGAVDLVLLSGLMCDDAVWRDITPALVGTRSVTPLCFADFSSIESMARHVLTSAPASFFLAGHSMGGRVALEVYRAAADRVRGIALLNTGVHPRRDTEIEGRLRLVELARTRGMAAVADEWLPPMMGDLPSRTDQVMPGLRAMVDRSTPQSLAAQTQALLDRPDATAVLATIRVPALLLSGEADRWSPVAQHRDMQARIPGSVLVAIEHAGHMAPVEQPAAVAAALNAWLARR